MAEAKPDAASGDGVGLDSEAAPVVVKKYANRRLYDTECSRYVTLADLAEMTRKGRAFVVRDARTDEDITAAILVQIILESESRGEHLLPIGFLRRLVALYGDTMQRVVPGYLESSMEVFVRNQELFRRQMYSVFSGSPTQGFERLQDINRALLESTLDLMTSPRRDAPSSSAEGAGAPGSGDRGPAGFPASGEAAEAQIREMRAQIEVLKMQVAALAGES